MQQGKITFSDMVTKIMNKIVNQPLVHKFEVFLYNIDNIPIIYLLVLVLTVHPQNTCSIFLNDLFVTLSLP